MLFSIAVCADCPKARLPSSFQGNDCAILVRSKRNRFPDLSPWLNRFWCHAGFQDPEYGWVMWRQIPHSSGGPCYGQWNVCQCKVTVARLATSGVWSLVFFFFFFSSKHVCVTALTSHSPEAFTYMLLSWCLTVWAGDLPWADLQHGRPQGRDPRLRLWQGRPHRSQGAGGDIQSLWEHIPDARAVQETAAAQVNHLTHHLYIAAG